MTGFDLPEECPECGYSGGWYIPDDYSLFVREDGEVKIGHGNGTRWGQKVKGRCNNPDCDAVVNLYLEAETVNNADIESTGAKEILEDLEQYDAIPKQVERTCSKCGQDFITDVQAELGDNAGIVLRAKSQCPDHRFSALIINEVETISPEELEDKSELLASELDNTQNSTENGGTE